MLGHWSSRALRLGLELTHASQVFGDRLDLIPSVLNHVNQFFIVNKCVCVCVCTVWCGGGGVCMCVYEYVYICSVSLENPD
jgi:hypothetical protein